MKTHADRIAELEAESARRAGGKCFVQLMYEFYTGGFRPVRPAAKVLQFPDPLGHKSERHGPERNSSNVIAKHIGKGKGKHMGKVKHMAKGKGFAAELQRRPFVFVIENFEIVTLSFLGFSARTRLGFLVVIFYLLGMVTGGSLFALLRRSIAGSGFNTIIKS